MSQIIESEIFPIQIEDELKKSYLDYAMSVIVGRALPDVRDGLKPVHRRVLFAMHELGNTHNKAYKKSARVVGDVIGKYHPHGDGPVYDTIVRMAQPFSMRYLLVDGQGNFGSVDGDNPAAMRYTEVRMTKVAEAALADIDQETVDFGPNYDGSEQMPLVLPTQVPALLVNGSSGIAVGMATNIPPHNLSEVINACLHLLDHPQTSIADLGQFISGPDFPTQGIIQGRSGIHQAYQTGRGRIYVRARSEIIQDEKTNKATILVTEIPYQVNKARLIERIAELVKEKKLEGISELRDESDKDGMRIVIELKRGEMPEVILNHLYSQTAMESVFGINMVALQDGQPKLFNLKQILEAFIGHRREVVTRRTLYRLRKAKERGHLLEGHVVALANIDEVVETIKSSATGQEAKEKLMAKSWKPGQVTVLLERSGQEDMCRPDDLDLAYGLRNGFYHLSKDQAQSILDLRLQKLTGLEVEKLTEEYEAKLAEIREYIDILSSEDRLLSVIREEMNKIKADFGDERRTEIQDHRPGYLDEDFISEEQVVLTISHAGYAKTQPLSDYRSQRRGGKGKAATAVKEEDFVEHLVVTSNLDTLLCFTTHGKLYWLRAYQVPQASRISRGRPLVNLFPFDENEKVSAILPISKETQGAYVFMATQNGTVKKVALELFSRPRSTGLIALDLDEGDALVGVAITQGNENVMLFSKRGKAIRFHEEDVRAMGRTARGVRGMRIGEDDAVIAMLIEKAGKQVLLASTTGYGKRTEIESFTSHNRGGSGMIAMNMSERNGQLMGAILVDENQELILISDQGTMVRTRISEISILSRNTQGVRLINLSDNETVVGIEAVEEFEENIAVDEQEIS